MGEGYLQDLRSKVDGSAQQRHLSKEGAGGTVIFLLSSRLLLMPLIGQTQLEARGKESLSDDNTQ